MKPFAYETPSSLAAAVERLGHGVRPLAGGTDLLTLMKEGLAEPEVLLALRDVLPRGIEQRGDGTTLGAGTTLADIAGDAWIAARYAALAEAAGLAASPPLRNMATLGGNLLQRPRCWYFRNPHIACWLKGGETCPAREGENRLHAVFDVSPCVAVHPSDPAAALLAFDASVRLVSPAGERTLGLGDFLRPPELGRRSETILGEVEIVRDIVLPALPEGARSTYLKSMERAAFSFALAGVAAVLHVASGEVTHARVVLSGVAPVPWRAEAAERTLLGGRAGDALFDRAAEAAVAGMRPLSGNAWKVPLAKALVQRALRAVAS